MKLLKGIKYMENVFFAIFLSLLAGLSTTIGSLIAFFLRKPNPRFISFLMGFSAGVMILISFVELLQQSIKSVGLLMGLMFFFLGMIIMFCIDVLVSHEYQFEDSIEVLINNTGECKPHSHFGHRRRKRFHGDKVDLKLMKTSMFIFIGIFIHNFPEGMATFLGTLSQINLGIVLAFAIALHNIPEGIAVAVPVYICTGDKKKAFRWSFISGMSEPLGAILTWLVLWPFINDYFLSAMLGAVGGIMIYISLDELLPASQSLGKEHISILGIISGMFVMAISLIII
jgi:ZIP family zinc transporter